MVYKFFSIILKVIALIPLTSGEWNCKPEALSKDGFIVTVQSSQSPYRSKCIYKSDDICKNNECYIKFEVQANGVNKRSVMGFGFATESFIKDWESKDEKINGFMYGEDITTAGEDIRDGDKIGVLLKKSKESITLNFWHNGHPLGELFSVQTNCNHSQLYPAFKTIHKSNINLNITETTPKDIDREMVDDLEGKWFVDDCKKEGESVIKDECNKYEFKIHVEDPRLYTEGQKGKIKVKEYSIRIFGKTSIEVTLKNNDGIWISTVKGRNNDDQDETKDADSFFKHLFNNFDSFEVESDKLIFKAKKRGDNIGISVELNRKPSIYPIKKNEKPYLLY